MTCKCFSYRLLKLLVVMILDPLNHVDDFKLLSLSEVIESAEKLIVLEFLFDELFSEFARDLREDFLLVDFPLILCQRCLLLQLLDLQHEFITARGD